MEIVFLIDQNQAQSDYYLSLLYVKTISGMFSDDNNRIRMGAYFSRPSDKINFTAQLAVFGNQVLSVAKPSGTITTNFLTSATSAINAFWPTARLATDPPRYLLTAVGSVDAQGLWSASQQSTFDQLRLNRGVEAWATGVGVGGTQIATLVSLSDPAIARAPLGASSYNHFVGLASSSVLLDQAADQAARMCPLADLCGGTCQGRCVCGVCDCPSCTANDPLDKCKSVSCKSPTAGCVAVDRRALFAPEGCLPNASAVLPCTNYGCDAVTGQCTAPTQPCTANCGCASLANCTFNDLSSCTGTCNPKTILCTGELCGEVCNVATGKCQTGITACDDGDGCTEDTCVVRLIGGEQKSVCQHTDNTGALCVPIRCAR